MKNKINIINIIYTNFHIVIFGYFKAFVIGLLLTLLFGCRYINRLEHILNEADTTGYIGIYKINIANSTLNNYNEENDSEKMYSYDTCDTAISNLKLTIRKDWTFEFSNDVPFIYLKQGTWTIAGDCNKLLGGILVLIYKNDATPFLCRKDSIPVYYKYGFHDHLIRNRDSTAYIFNPLPKDGEVQVYELYFDKIK